MIADMPAESAALQQVVQRLSGRFPDVPVGVVQSTVAEVYASLADAHVRDFLPVIVEREAKKQLKRSAV